MPLRQPKQCFNAQCPLAGQANGFVADEGNPQTAKLTICLDAPAQADVTAFAEPGELARRNREYLDVPVEILKRGRPAISDFVPLSQILTPLGIHRNDVYLMHTLRCCPDMSGRTYPTGDTLKKAVACCRQWDRHMQPTMLVSTFRPRDLTTDITPLPLAVRAVEKARDAAAGERVMVLAGGKVVKAIQGYRENVNRYVGDYTLTDDSFWSARRDVWAGNRELVIRVKGERIVRQKKLTTRTALAMLLNAYTLGDGYAYVTQNTTLSAERYAEIAALVAAKPKKGKETT